MANQLYSYSQIESGLSGYFNETSDPTRKRFNDNATMFLSITGTDASLKVNGGGPNPYKVFVDGVETVPTIVGGLIDLFSGLTDTRHMVSMIAEPAYVTDNNWLTIGEAEILSVTGATPDVTPIPVEFVSWSTFNGISTESILAAPGGNITPLEPQTIEGNLPVGECVFNAQCDEIYVFTSSDNARYAVDGGTPTKTTVSNNVHRRVFLLSDLLDNTQTHRYTIFSGDVDSGDWGIQGVACLNSGVPVSATSPGIKKSFYQYGDSITRGVSAVNSGDVDNWQVAINIDAITAQFGVSGQTTSELTLLIPTYFTSSIIPDYVLLATGRNDTGSGTLQADYTACIQAFLNEGCTNILCRGILPEGVNTWETENSAIQSAIASFSNPNVVFIDTSTWAGIETQDGVHPSAAGYVTIANYETPVLSAIIIPPTVYEVTGVTYDKTGVILPDCQVSLFKHSGSGVFVYISTVVSDALTGYYSFGGLDNNDPNYMIYAHKADIPDVFDCSNNDLIPTEVI